MSAVDLPVVGFQIVLPVALLTWFAVAPFRSIIGLALQAIGSASVLAAVALIPVWLVPPWWTPWAYMLALLLILTTHLVRPGFRFSGVLPKSAREWAATAVAAAFGAYALVAASGALWGRYPPVGEIVDLPYPMGSGAYLVANGGSTETVNAHHLTLLPKTERQSDHHGQSFAVDLVKINRAGFRASGWRPRDPAAYEIFGEAVYAPCDGTVLEAENGRPDMPVPEPDTNRILGNHVLIDCGAFGVVFAHFKQGSVSVIEGESVSLGQQIGAVGNSGQTFEPHLHVHVQRLVDEGPPISGEPVHFRLGGAYLVRNDRYSKP